MENTPLITRYELKFPFENLSRFEMESWVRLHSWGFRVAYPPRQVNNIYFDSLSMDTFNDHIEGVPLRRKLRYRWYGRDLAQARGQLEVKNKSERAGWKLIQPVDEILHLDQMSWGEIMKVLRSHADGIFRELLEVSGPVLINHYQREYYVSGDGRVRLTLDYDLCSYRQWVDFFPNLSFKLPELDSVLIEIKSDVIHGREVSDVIAEFPLRAWRYSKYVDGMDSILER